MSLTPADVRNAVFSKPRLGERGYCEEEVDLLLELVEDELVRHIEEKEQLRKLIATLRDRTDRRAKADAELREWDAELRRWDADIVAQESELRRYDAALKKRAEELRRHEAALENRAAQLRQSEATLAQKAIEIRQSSGRSTEPAVHQHHGVVRQNGTVIHARLDQQRSGVSEEQRIMAVRTVAGAHGKHDLEWMAIRSVADGAGNGVTETVQQQWTCTTETDQGERSVTSIEAAQVKQLQEENAQLMHVNGILKAAAARFATELHDHPLTVDDLVGS